MQKTIIFLLIALLLPSVSAEFLAFGDLEVKLGPCDALTRNLTIQNTGQEQATYSISVDGEGSDYITFSAINFALQPGQYAVINTFYNIPCNTKPAEYPVNIYFSDGQIEQQLEQTLTVTLADNINLTTTSTSAVIPPCETAAYTINLHNPLNFTEIYTITASGHPNVHVSEKQAVLNGKERRNIIVSVTPDDCTQSGIYPLTAEFSTEKSNQQKEQPLELIIKSTDIPILAEGTNKIRTDYTDSTAELTIQNTGDRITQYTLAIQGVNWATINPDTVTLNPGQTKTVALRLAPKEEVQTGTYPVILTATVDQTGIKYSKELTIKLQPPTFIEKNPAIILAIIIIILAALVCAYFLIKYLRSDNFKASMRRWKEKRIARRKAREQIRKEREQKRAELQKRRIEEQKKEAERRQAEKERIKRQLQRQVEQDFKKEYHVVARKELITGKSGKNTRKILAIIFGIILIILLAIFWSIIIPNIQYVAIGLAVLAVIYIAHRLARMKVIKTHWRNLIEKQTTNINAWRKGLSLLSITAKKPVQNFGILIKKTKARIAPSQAVYQTYLIKTNADEAVSLKATFTIPKRWIKRKHVGTDEIKLGRYANQNWTTIPLKKTGETKDAVHYTAEIKPGTYSIYTKPPKQPAKNLYKIFWGIIGIALIVGIAVVLSPEPTTQSYAIPPQVWKQNTIHHIDLSQYFSDPDGDKLNYKTTETKYISVEITGNTAYLTPETGWTGEERIRFTASDGKNGTASSNTVPLRVQKETIPAKIQPYIAVILSLITVILLIWLAYTHSRSKNK